MSPLQPPLLHNELNSLYDGLDFSKYFPDKGCRNPYAEFASRIQNAFQENRPLIKTIDETLRGDSSWVDFQAKFTGVLSDPPGDQMSFQRRIEGVATSLRIVMLEQFARYLKAGGIDGGDGIPSISQNRINSLPPREREPAQVQAQLQPQASHRTPIGQSFLTPEAEGNLEQRQQDRHQAAIP